MRVFPLSCLLALVALAGACSDPAPPAADSGGGADLGAGDGAAPDQTAADADPTPIACQTGEACNALLDPQGRCPGRCFAQPSELTCRGQVVNGLCFRKPPQRDNKPVTAPGLTFTPLVTPSVVVQGQSATFSLRVSNTAAQAVSLPFAYQVGGRWSLLDASFKGLTTLDLAAGEAKTLTAKLQAVTPDVFGGGLSSGAVITFTLNNRAYPIKGTVAYAAGPGTVACGQHNFPAQRCPTPPNCTSTSTHYQQAVCCGGVFYPGSNCCDYADCAQGACVDGTCRAGPLSLANTWPAGHLRILVVLSDQADQPHDPAAVCTDRYAALKGALELDGVEGSLRALTKRFAGKQMPQIKWTVLAGIKTADFNPAGGLQLKPMHDALQTYLQARGCQPAPAQFDKRILISPKLDLQGYSGQAGAGGLVGMKPMGRYLMVHELLHTFGGRDLYKNLGGQLHYAFDWMSSRYGSGEPEAGVVWGEIGLGDLNRDGVIDLFEYAAAPDALLLREARAAITGKGTLEVLAEVGATEGGVVKRARLDALTVSLPATGASYTVQPGQPAVFEDGKEVDLAAVKSAGAVKVRVTASLSFTDSAFKRQTLSLGVDKTLPAKAD